MSDECTVTRLSGTSRFTHHSSFFSALSTQISALSPSTFRPTGPTMVKRLVDFALDQRIVTLALVELLVAMGLYAYRELPVEAFPDPDDPHVQVITIWPGQAAEEVETQVTRPIEQQLNSCLLYTSPSPRDRQKSRMPSSA